eukprot:m.41285 g.41285  ORF g.41285 m.41285 type:complete len:673 (-) comp18750_c1_seq1:163-2181(-)
MKKPVSKPTKKGGAGVNVWLASAVTVGCLAVVMTVVFLDGSQPEISSPISAVPGANTKMSANEPEKSKSVKDKTAQAPKPKMNPAQIQKELRKSEAIDKASPALTDAIQRLKQILPRTPRSLVADVHLEIANKFEVIADTSSVDVHLRAALRLSKQIPGEIYGHSAMALANFMLRHNRTHREEIIDYLRIASKRLKNHDDASHWLGHQLMRSPVGFEEAEKVLTTVRLEKLTQSHHVDTIMLLGQAKERMGKLDESAEVFHSTEMLYVKLKNTGQEMPERIQFRFALSQFQYCRLLLILGKPNEAYLAASAALREFPQVYHLYDVAALALGNLGELAKVKQIYEAYAMQLKTWPQEHAYMPLRVLGATLALIRVNADNEKKKQSTIADPALDDWGDGGWPESELVLSNDDIDHCNIDRRNNLSKKEFIEQYADRNLPVIIRGLLTDWKAKQAWTRESFVDIYGAFNISVRQSSQVAYDNEFGGLTAKNMSIKEYVETIIDAKPTASIVGDVGGDGGDENIDPPYVLSTSLNAIPALKQDISALAFFNDVRFSWPTHRREESALLYVGQAGSGVSLHEHTNAWNALVFGKKRWLLLPPYSQYGPTGLPHQQWMTDWYPKFKAKAKVCTQEPGDVLYVPTNWMHSVLNVKASIGIAVESGHDPNLLFQGLSKLS